MNIAKIKLVFRGDIFGDNEKGFEGDVKKVWIFERILKIVNTGGLKISGSQRVESVNWFFFGVEVNP